MTIEDGGFASSGDLMCDVVGHDFGFPLGEHPGLGEWLSHLERDAGDIPGCGFALVETRHTARLRGAISGGNKTDDVDASMLAASVDLFDLSAGELPGPGPPVSSRLGRPGQLDPAAAWSPVDVVPGCSCHPLPIRGDIAEVDIRQLPGRLGVSPFSLGDDPELDRLFVACLLGAGGSGTSGNAATLGLTDPQFLEPGVDLVEKPQVVPARE